MTFWTNFAHGLQVDVPVHPILQVLVLICTHGAKLLYVQRYCLGQILPIMTISFPRSSRLGSGDFGGVSSLAQGRSSLSSSGSSPGAAGLLVLATASPLLPPCVRRSPPLEMTGKRRTSTRNEKGERTSHSAVKKLIHRISLLASRHFSSPPVSPRVLPSVADYIGVRQATPETFIPPPLYPLYIEAWRPNTGIDCVRSREAALSRPSPIRPTRSCCARGRRPAPLGGLLGDEGGLAGELRLPCRIWAVSPLARFVPSRGWAAGTVEAARGGKTRRPRVQGGRGARWRHRRSGACWLAWNGSVAEALIGRARGGVPFVFPLALF
jgi:hypothetical protein